MSAGYSGTPLPQKLGIRPAARVALVAAPAEAAELIAPLPPGARVLGRPGCDMDVVVFFARRRAELERRFEPLKATLAEDGSLWIARPKRASGVATDLTENVVREVALAGGLVDTKVCAIDETWSGLRLVRRLRDRSR